MSVLRRQQLSKRDDDYNNDWPDRNWYWSDVCYLYYYSTLITLKTSKLTLSQEARTVKYGVLFGVLLLSFGVIMGMWIHADRRMKSGLPPLRYHRVRNLPIHPSYLSIRYSPHIQRACRNQKLNHGCNCSG